MNEKRLQGHLIREVLPESIAMELEIEPGDRLLAINQARIEDIFDYQYYVEDNYIEVLIEKPDGEQWVLEIDKDEDEDIGIVFENGLMDDYRSCQNKCIFCFIDQMPKGMRETLYFKDDDSRLSFLQGNYVTLTNMSDHDIDRIIKYHLSPINISFQTMNQELRCKMLNNRFAGKALEKAERLYQAGVAMNGQIVLCKGVNDGEELAYSIRKLMEYIPVLESVSVVPVGLSKYREGLYPLEPFTKKDAEEVLELVHGFQKEIYQKYGTHFIHASDEWYILAGQELPPKENYDGYVQLENGVGMLRLLLDEFEDALEDVKAKSGQRLEGDGKAKLGQRPEGDGKAKLEQRPEQDGKVKMEQRTKKDAGKPKEGQFTAGELKEISIATGKLAYPYILKMSQEIAALFPGLVIHVYEIINHFFGEMITVSGLLTGQDMIAQLQGKRLGERLLLPQNTLRSGEEVFLDDVTVQDMEKALQVKIDIVKSSGYDFVETVLRN